MTKIDFVRVKKQAWFWWLMILISASIAAPNYGHMVNEINTTMFAFTYKYGFISRGFIGSLMRVFNQIIPIEIINYEGVFVFTWIFTAFYYLAMAAFFFICMQRVREDVVKHTEYLIAFFTVYTSSMFVTQYNFGRLDMYLVLLTYIGMMLLIEERYEWLLVPISAVCVMIHQGYVLMYFNVFLILLFYKIVNNAAKRKKYILIFTLSLLICGALLIYFEFFSHIDGSNGVYDEVCFTARLVSYDGVDIHQDVIDKEILGIDISDHEVKYKLQNAVEFPLYLLFCLPYLIIAFRFFRNCVKQAGDFWHKLFYLALAVGSLTMVPDLLLKCDFGRWMFAILFYYFATILALMAMGDEIILNQVKMTMHNLKQNPALAVFLLIYAVGFAPYRDVRICRVIQNISEYLNTNYLHLWVTS